MDLIPKPDQVVSAAGNVAHRVVYGSLADLRPMPRTLIDDGTLREVYHYRPAARAHEQGDPVLLVTPLAAPGHLLRPPPWLLAGRAPRRRRSSYLSRGVRRGLVQEPQPRHGALDRGGRPDRDPRGLAPTPAADRCTWSAGRSVACSRCSPPPATRTCRSPRSPRSGSPFDVREVPLVAPLRPLLNFTDGRGAITRLYQAAGGAPQPLVRWAFQLSSFQKLVTKPLAIARNLDDADYLAQIEAVDRFTDNMIAYPGRTFGQLYHRLLKGNALVDGTFEVGDRTLSVGDITAPVLVFAGAADGIAPVASVKASVPLLTGAARRAVRDRARWPPGDAHRPEGTQQHLAGAGRVDRPVVGARAAARARPSYDGEATPPGRRAPGRRPRRHRRRRHRPRRHRRRRPRRKPRRRRRHARRRRRRRRRRRQRPAPRQRPASTATAAPVSPRTSRSGPTRPAATGPPAPAPSAADRKSWCRGVLPAAGAVRPLGDGTSRSRRRTVPRRALP